MAYIQETSVFYNISFIMSRKITLNIIFSLQDVTDYRLPENSGSAGFSILHYRYKLDTIFHLFLDPPREKLYRFEEKLFLPYELSIGGFWPWRLR